jgi:hypothetical protein
MGRKLFVALQPESVLHFFERYAGGRIERIEPPVAFGAAKTPETRLLNPYQPPAHERLGRCAPTSIRMLSRDGTCRFATNGSFLSGVPPGLQQNTVTQSWVPDD